MKPELPQVSELQLKKDPSIPSSWRFEPGSGVVLLVSDADRKAMENTPWADFLASRLPDYPKTTNPVIFSAPSGERAAVVFVPDPLKTFKSLTLARKAIAPVIADRLKEINVISLLGDDTAAAAMAESLVAAARAALFQLPKVTEKPP